MNNTKIIHSCSMVSALGDPSRLTPSVALRWKRERRLAAMLIQWSAWSQNSTQMTQTKRQMSRSESAYATWLQQLAQHSMLVFWTAFSLFERPSLLLPAVPRWSRGTSQKFMHQSWTSYRPRQVQIETAWQPWLPKDCPKDCPKVYFVGFVLEGPYHSRAILMLKV